MTAENPLRCTFCRKSETQVQTPIQGGSSGVYICDECVHVCNDVLRMEHERRGPRLDGLMKCPACGHDWSVT
jgi:ATP-dependent Clp protease ATP-binding subunit ClpX